MMHEHKPPRAQLTEAEADRVADVLAQHRRFIEQVASRHACRPDDVPDILQSVSVRLCTSLNGFRGHSELRTWLYRVTVNVARDHYNREARQVRAAEAVRTAGDEYVVDPDERAIIGQRLDALQDAVTKLRPTYQTAIQNIICDETGGSAVQITERASKSQRSRARRQLRGLLSDDPRF